MGKSKEIFMDERQHAEAEKNDSAIVGMIRIPNVEINKVLITEEVDRIAEAVDEGFADPIKFIAYMNALERVMKATRARIMENGLEEFAKYGEKRISVLGNCEVEQAEAGIRFDFSNTEAWVEIKERENVIAKERKELEATLKTLKKPTEMQIDDELTTLNPAIRTSTTTLKITIK